MTSLVHSFYQLIRIMDQSTCVPNWAGHRTNLLDPNIHPLPWSMTRWYCRLWPPQIIHWSILRLTLKQIHTQMCQFVRQSTDILNLITSSLPFLHCGSTPPGYLQKLTFKNSHLRFQTDSLQHRKFYHPHPHPPKIPTKDKIWSRLNVLREWRTVTPSTRRNGVAELLSHSELCKISSKLSWKMLRATMRK